MSVSTKIRSALHALGLLALFAVAPGALAAPATLTFSSNAGLGDAIASDGDGGSLDIPGKDIQIINISDTAGTNRGAIHWRGPAFGIPSALTYDDGANGTTKGMAIRSGDGAEFRLVSFDYLNWGETAPFTNTVVGYRDGAQVASTTFPGFNPAYELQTIALDSTFANVDEVRLFISAGGDQGDLTTWHSMNNIVIDDAVVPLPPVVSDARIAISGASGTGGAYKIGDTVTATWNNTASGDNNTGVTGVTVDFTAFGGGTAVVAISNANIWTASYTLAAGAIDAVNRNVSVTATNNFGSTTTADTSNASVDNVAPTVTAANIAISGGTGTGGAYKIGDTVSATWNNTAGGDNNSDTISNVTVDFSGFGGGASVAATNSGGTWTATYSLVAGGVSAGNRNVSVSATDNAGNITTRAGTANATVDNMLPAVVSIAPAGGASDTDTSVTFTVTFTESVTGVSADDFSLTFTGSAGGSIASVSGSGAAFNLVVSGITGTGTLRVNLNSVTGILDSAGNGPPAAFNTGSPHTVAIPVAPDAPVIGAATAGDRQASISFSAPADNGGAAITSYTVTSSPGNVVGSGASSPIVVTGLTNGTAYTFTVTASNAAGTSPASAASNSVTPKAEQSIIFNNPGAQNFGTTPTVTATSDSSLPVTFTSSTTGVCTVTSGGTLTFVVAGSCTLNADQAGDTAYLPAPQVSQTFSVNAIVPGAPTGITAIAGDREASVAFNAPAFNGGSAVTGYTVTSNPGGLTAMGVAGPIMVNGLTNGVSYTFTVTASNAAGTGAASGASNAITPASPQDITFNNPGAQNFGTTPTLTATSSSGLAPTFTSATTGVCVITSGGTLAFVAAGTCTVNADQTGNASYLPAPQISRSFTVNPVAPGAPTAITATAGDTQASVAFTAPAFTGGSAVTGYTVTSNPGGLTGTGAVGPITVNGLTNGVSYTFTVVADNAAGTGVASLASNAVTPAAGQTITFANPGAQAFGTSPTLVASADSGLPVTFTSSTTGVCTVTSGGTLTFLAAGSCTINADQAGDASNAPALQVSQSFAVNAVAPGAPGIGAASIAGPGAVAVTFSAPTFAGGAAITGYTVTSSPGGVSATGVGSPVTLTGLDPGTAYTFTVTATNTAGTGSASGATASVTPVPALEVDPVFVTVAYGASASPVDLAITGTPTSVGIASAPQHGVAVVSGTTITYQPAAGYAGQDSFTYTASDAYTTTTPAMVTVTVAAPSVALDATAPPAATGGTTYTHALVASGGAAPYTFNLVGGRLPQGLVLSANGALSGTPTESGDFAFTAAVVDSSTGTGPFTAQRAYALEVAAPVISLSLPATLDAIYGDALEQTLDATGGTAPYTYTVIDGALPAGLVLSTSGRLSGAPSVAGRFDVTAQVRDANGFTASQGFELVVSQAVQSITGFATNPAAPVFAPDGTFALNAEGGASGLPLVFASTSPTVCTVEGAVVTMRAAGQCSLTADQAGDANFEAAPQVRLDVEIAAAVPTLVWPEQLNKILGEAAFALDDPDSPSAGTFAFSSSQREVASIDGRTVTLHGEGVAIITATQAAAGNYAAASIEMRLSVTTRPDPTRDPGVTGLLQAQVDASVRFAQAQQSNIRDRLRQVRSGANASFSNVTLTYDGGVNGQGLSAPVGQAAAGLWPAMPAGWGAWVSGTATVGGRGGASAYDFDTDGITVGADRALSDQVLIGVAGSLAHNNSELDAVGGSRMQADQRSVALYGLWRAGEHVFVDALAGAGRLEFDLRRWSSDAGALATGARKGDQWFASLAMGYEHRGPAMTLTSYGRVDTSRSTLDAYREYGLDLYDLAYRRQDVDSTTVALGLEGSYRIGGDTGRVRPFWTLEYREALENRNDAAMNYVILPQATDYSFAMRSYNDNALTLSGGLDVRLTGGWALSLLLGHEQASQSTQNSSIGLRLTYGTQPTGLRGSADAAGGRRRAAGCTNACDATSGTTTTSAGGPHGE